MVETSSKNRWNYFSRDEMLNDKVFEMYDRKWTQLISIQFERILCWMHNVIHYFRYSRNYYNFQKSFTLNWYT